MQHLMIAYLTGVRIYIEINASISIYLCKEYIMRIYD